ncbi:NAD-dependent epimerase/dehydratase family protein [Candidatus Woesebacteria bacterium]|nr:MAG: NAD-dependent epimerase/dehydratase family protein [Candidatus Woesebacteria bacterium]
MDKIILITGVSGEVGIGLLDKLSKSTTKVVGLDVNEVNKDYRNKLFKFIKLDITDSGELDKLFAKYKFDTIYHLAALLSTSAEKNPENAHKINVDGTFNLLTLANKYAQKRKSVTKFIFPSTIAVYGMGNLKNKNKFTSVKENEFLTPITMYGVNKLYCESLGNYISNYYKLLENNKRYLDFRAVRFPGLLSALTTPTGGTSDYAPEMIHYAAKGESYACFVRNTSTIGFMAMPDAVNALLTIASSSKNRLTQYVYNVASFSVSADEIKKQVEKYFPGAKISYRIDAKRQSIVDSWPQSTNDQAARRDWNWKPKYTFSKTFGEYLIPTIKLKYQK